MAGTAVSIASLGIQVCQGLVSYYDSYKNFDDNVAKTIKSVTHLAQSLQHILVFLQRQKSASASVQQTCESVKHCQSHITSLQIHLAKFDDDADDSHIRGKLKTQLRRLYFPFKEGTIGSLRDIVSDALGALGPALDLLELEKIEELSATATRTEEIARTVQQGKKNLTISVNDQY